MATKFPPSRYSFAAITRHLKPGWWQKLFHFLPRGKAWQVQWVPQKIAHFPFLFWNFVNMSCTRGWFLKLVSRGVPWERISLYYCLYFLVGGSHFTLINHWQRMGRPRLLLPTTGCKKRSSLLQYVSSLCLSVPKEYFLNKIQSKLSNCSKVLFILNTPICFNEN